MLVGFGISLFLFGHDPFTSSYGRRVTACALLLHLLINMTLPILGYVYGPDWMWGYFVDHRQVPSWLPVWVFVLYQIPFGFSYLLGARLSKRGWKWPAGAFVLTLIAQVTIIGLSFDRYVAVGTTEEFHAGTAAPLPESAVAPVFNIGGAVAAIVAVAIIVWLVRTYKKLGPPAPAPA